MLLAFILLMLMMLWRIEDRRQIDAAKDFIALPASEREAVLVTSAMLRSRGIDPADPVTREKLEALFALGSAMPPPDVLASLTGATDTERRRLEDMIRTEEWREPTEEPATQRIAGQLRSAAASREAVTEAIRRNLGPLVAAHGGTIEPDGSIVFPDTVLFDVGAANITQQLREFLSAICLPWIRTVEQSGAAVSDLRIEGHASSEWTRESSQQQAYLNNLALSQQRAHAVLSTCLEMISGPEGNWARQRATAVGYSSSHPVLTNGIEDPAKSRRVVFRVDFDLEPVIDDIQDVVDESGARRAKLDVFLPSETGMGQ